VTLNAGAASGSLFTGWSGACTGRGDCVLTVAADTAATAYFTRCAATSVTNFTTSTNRSQRRAQVHLTLAGRATVTARLLRRSQPIGSPVTHQKQAGPVAITLTLPKKASLGTYRIQLRITDACGGVRTLSKPITI
jgi:hypothetical protein